MSVRRAARDWSGVDGADDLRVERDGAVQLVVIDRTEARNSLTLDGQAALVGCWREAQRDPGVRAVVLAGAPDPRRTPDDQAFCSGSDVKELEREAAAGNAFAGFPLDEGFPSLAADAGGTPVIAAVEGWCVGAGMTLMLATDLRVASMSAAFGVPEVALGVVPGNGGIRRAMQELPPAVVRELLLLGHRLDAARALELGLVNAVVAPGEALATAMAWAHRVAALPPEAVAAALELAARSPRLAPEDAARLERVWMGVLQRHAPDRPTDEA